MTAITFAYARTIMLSELGAIPEVLPELPPVWDNIPRDYDIDLTGYIPAWANPGYLIHGKSPFPSCTSWCTACDTHWSGTDPCFVCGNDPIARRWRIDCV